MKKRLERKTLLRCWAARRAGSTVAELARELGVRPDELSRAMNHPSIVWPQSAEKKTEKKI